LIPAKKFIGKLNRVYAQLVIVKKPLSKETKLGFIRNALERGSQRFTEVLSMCKFNKLNYNDTLKRLLDFEQEYHLNMFSKSTSRGEKKNIHILETMNNTNENNNYKKNNNLWIVGIVARKVIKLLNVKLQNYVEIVENWT
jgi:hypothetical protein